MEWVRDPSIGTFDDYAGLARTGAEMLDRAADWLTWSLSHAAVQVAVALRRRALCSYLSAPAALSHGQPPLATSAPVPDSRRSTRRHAGSVEAQRESSSATASDLGGATTKLARCQAHEGRSGRRPSPRRARGRAAGRVAGDDPRYAQVSDRRARTVHERSHPGDAPPDLDDG